MLALRSWFFVGACLCANGTPPVRTLNKTRFLARSLQAFAPTAAAKFIPPIRRTVTVNGQPQVGYVLEMQYGSDTIRFECIAEKGGLITAYKLNGKNVLLDSPDGTTLDGSTFWVSPQSAWDWPPPTAWDQAVFSGSVDEAVHTITLTGPVDPQLQLSLVKTFSVNIESPPSVLLEYSIINHGGASIGVAPWEISRVPPGGLTFYPTGTGTPTSGKFDPIPTIQAQGATWFQHTPSHLSGSHKLFADGSRGWLAHADTSQGLVFVKAFDDVPKSAAAPGEGEIELYATSQYEEVEQQGAYQTLVSKATRSWRVEWYVQKPPSDVAIDEGSSALVSFVDGLLRTGSGTTVTATTTSAAPITTSDCFCAHPHSCFAQAPWEGLRAMLSNPALLEDVKSLDLANPNGPAQNDPLWLADQPGGMQHSGGMGSPTRPGWCVANSTPAKVVRLQTAADAKHAVKFAAEHKLALSVKSTGHEWFGRSTVVGSLLLWTHEMTGTTWHNDFTPAGCSAPLGGAVSLGAGVQFWQLYNEATEHQRLVIGGSCSSVGHVGFSLWGGYGDMSRMYGSGATNLLEAEVVLANGELVTASSCNENAELFKALRGGGAGFGLVTKLTYRTFPMPAAGTAGKIRGNLNSGNYQADVEACLAWYHKIVKDGLAKHFGGKFFFFNGNVDVQLEFVGLSISKCSKLVASLPGMRCEAKHGNIWKDPDAVTSPNGSPGWMPKWAGDSASAYYSQTLTRYLLPEHLSTTNGRRGKLAKTVSDLAGTLPLNWKNFFSLSLNYALGHGDAAVQERLADTLVHPNVGKAIGALKLTRRRHPVNPTSSWQIDHDNWNNQQLFVSRLDTLLGPGVGSYATEGDYTDGDWPEQYWGANYAQLRALKKQYDPKGMFTCNQCVGDDPSTFGRQPKCVTDPTTTRTTTTLATTTLSEGSPITLTMTSTTTIGQVSPCSAPHEQCGGVGWNGPVCCVAGWACKGSNKWYSQCQPADIVTKTETTTPMITTTELMPSPSPTTVVTSAMTTTTEAIVTTAPTTTTKAIVTTAPTTTTDAIVTTAPTTTTEAIVTTAPTTTTEVIVTTSTEAIPTLVVTTMTTSMEASCSSGHQQCGGVGWTGPRCCSAGFTCVESNQWYAQCRP